MIFIFLLAALLAFVITFMPTPITIFFAGKFGLVDNPNTRKHPAHTHKETIPRAGGLPIFLGIFISAALIIPFNKQLFGILTGAAILIIVGLLDDKKDLSPYLRFLTNCLAVLIVIGAGIGIPYITNPFGGVLSLDQWKITLFFSGKHSIIVWADIVAFIWILWTTNIIGWSGGVDGQLPGFVSIAAAIIGFLSLRYTFSDPKQIYVTLLSFAVFGAFLGFLPWNFYPQKIMPGYGGKTLAGFMLAVISILAFSKLGTALLVLAIPMIDAFFMLGRRLLSRKSPVWATSGHLHHHLLSLGWGRRRIAVFYWFISLTVGIIALFVNSKQKFFLGILFFVLIVGFILWVNMLQKNLIPPSRHNG